jgi:hypothetical protein
VGDEHVRDHEILYEHDGPEGNPPEVDRADERAAERARAGVGRSWKAAVRARQGG